MAIYNGRILMRKGNEADFDASKLMSGEWAVSLDKGIVRICLEAGKVIRMATYEAFEEDMKQIEAILLECQTIEEAVQRINTEINAKVEAVVEYVGQAKTYRDEALQFRNEAEAFKNQAGEIAGIGIATTEKAGIVKPDGETLEVDADGTMRVIGGGGVSDYSELENKPSINGTELNGNKTLNDLGIASATELEKTNTKVDTIIEKADLGIKETATGEELHLIDSAEGKAVEFALYGKATQDGEPTPENPQEIEVSGESYNELEISIDSQTVNGGTVTVNEDKSITVNGNFTAETTLILNRVDLKANTGYILSGCPSGESITTYRLLFQESSLGYAQDTGNGVSVTPTEDIDSARITLQIFSGTVDNLTFYPMLRKASVKNDRYMPYGKGSVEVKSENEDGTKSITDTIPTPNGLAGIKVSSNGNYTDQNGQHWICDEIVKYADGSGAFVQRVGRKVFDGSEDWRYTTSNDKELLLTRSLNGLGKKGQSIVEFLCSHFVSYAGGTHWAHYKGTLPVVLNTYELDTQFSILEKLGAYGSVTAFKEWLVSNPIEVLYELAEPITTPLTAEEIAEISTFYPVTNISNDFDCGMRIEYVGDSIITTNTEIPIVEPKDEEELESGDNIVTLFGKIKKKLKSVGKGVVDNLLSTSTDLPLSANQGRVLDEKIGTINERLKLKTLTVNTNDSGLIGLDLDPTLYFAIMVRCNGYVCEPYFSGSNCGARIISRSNGNPITNTSVTVEVLYMSIT